MHWFGLGKPRTRFGEWIDERGIKQEEVSKRSGLNRNIVSRLANEDDARPSWRTRKRLMDALRGYDDDVRGDDFWGE